MDVKEAATEQSMEGFFARDCSVAIFPPYGNFKTGQYQRFSTLDNMDVNAGFSFGTTGLCSHGEEEEEDADAH